MIYSTGPALLISLVLYYLLGLRFSASVIDQGKINIILDGLKNNFYISPIAFIPPLIVIVLAVKKYSGLAVMVIASIVGSAFAMIFQGFSLAEMLNFLQNGYVSNVGIAEIDALLSRGGLQSMMWTISLGFVALSFGGLLEKTRMLEVLLDKIKGLVKTTGGLITTHVVSSIFVNIFSASQYMAIIIPGRMLVPVYKEKKILPQVASRVCEDSGTVTSPLVPWGLCGVYFAGVLGVPTMAYFPYVFLSFLAPAITILYGVTDKFIFREGDINSVRTYSGENHEKVV